MNNDQNNRRKYGRPSSADGTNLLHLLRTMHGLSLEELSQYTGISAMSLCKIEKGRHTSVRNLITLSAFFGVPADAFLRSLNGRPLREDMLQRIESLPTMNGTQLRRQMSKARVGNRLAGTGYENAVSEAPAKNPRNGYDVVSFRRDGTPIFIEVKSTKDPKNVPFYMSDAELRKLKSLRSSKDCEYRLVRIYDLGNPDGYQYETYTADEVLAQFDFEVDTYRVKKKEAA